VSSIDAYYTAAPSDRYSQGSATTPRRHRHLWRWRL